MIEQKGNRWKLVCDGDCHEDGNGGPKTIWFNSYRECMDFIHDSRNGWTFEKYDNGGVENFCPDCK